MTKLFGAGRVVYRNGYPRAYLESVNSMLKYGPNDSLRSGVMNKIDATKYLRQMKHLPNVTPLCGVYIVILTLFMVPPISWGKYYKPSEARFAQPLPLDRVVITCGKNGYLTIEEKVIEDRNEFPAILLDYMEERCLSDKKVFLKVGADAPWGDVVDLMQMLEKAGFEVSGFTEGSACFLDFMKPDRNFREKGLIMPGSKK